MLLQILLRSASLSLSLVDSTLIQTIVEECDVLHLPESVLVEDYGRCGTLVAGPLLAYPLDAQESVGTIDLEVLVAAIACDM